MSEEGVLEFFGLNPSWFTILALSPVVQVTKNHISVNGGVKKTQIRSHLFLTQTQYFRNNIAYCVSDRSDKLYLTTNKNQYLQIT